MEEMDHHGDGATRKQSNYDVSLRRGRARILRDASSCHMANYITCQAVIYRTPTSSAAAAVSLRLSPLFDIWASDAAASPGFHSTS